MYCTYRIFLYYSYCIFYGKIYDCDLYWSCLQFINATTTLSPQCPFPPCRSLKIKPGNNSVNRDRFLWKIAGISSCVWLEEQLTWSRARGLQINEKTLCISHATLPVCYFMDSFNIKLQSRLLSMTTMICMYSCIHIYIPVIYMFILTLYGTIKLFTRKKPVLNIVTKLPIFCNQHG